MRRYGRACEQKKKEDALGHILKTCIYQTYSLRSNSITSFFNHQSTQSFIQFTNQVPHLTTTMKFLLTFLLTTLALTSTILSSALPAPAQDITFGLSDERLAALDVNILPGADGSTNATFTENGIVIGSVIEYADGAIAVFDAKGKPIPATPDELERRKKGGLGAILSKWRVRGWVCYLSARYFREKTDDGIEVG